MLVGTLAVVLFMALTYGRFGIYADLALVVNVLMILGVMALANTTLTLPGIAGFVLTIGAAVDANVLVNERIREERARAPGVSGGGMGYRRPAARFSMPTSPMSSPPLMFFFGSGPVKGFAVVLVIGIVTSVYRRFPDADVGGRLAAPHRPSDLNI